MPNEIPLVFNNGSKYDHSFITKELGTVWFKGQFGCRGKRQKCKKLFQFFNRKGNHKS